MSLKSRIQTLAAIDRPLRWVLPLFILGGMILLQILAPEWSARFEGWTIDQRFSLRGVQEPQSPIVIVALDESSVQSLGDLEGENIRTWPRKNWALLLEKIAAENPAVIALDADFDTPGWDEGGDEAFSDALAAAGNVVLVSHFEYRYTDTGSFLSFTYSPPIAELAEASAEVGVGSFPQGQEDDVIRQMTPLWDWGEELIPSLSTATAFLYQGKAIDIPKKVLTEEALINFRGPEGTFQTISMIDVWQDVIPEGIFEDAIVLVGFTTELEQDRHATPFATAEKMPGVEIHANAIDTLLTRDWMYQPASWVELVMIGLAGVLAVGLVNLRRPVVSLISMVGSVIVFLVAAQLVFSQMNLILPVVAPVLTCVLVFGVGLGERMIFAERDKRLLRQRFAGMMSPERLEAVMDNWEGLQDFNRPAKDAAVLFCDIRGFTHATETLMQQGRSTEMVAFLSRYLDVMGEAILSEGGVIYRMLGDGLLVMFGMPEPIENEALCSVRAAVKMALAAEGLQAEWPLRDETPIQMGIGIHYGKMVDAIVGRGRRVDYAIIGDPANTAARIEAYCKEAVNVPRPPGGEVPENTTILISDELYQKVQNQILGDKTVPPFAARGKSEALRVVRVLGLKEGSAI